MSARRFLTPAPGEDWQAIARRALPDLCRTPPIERLKSWNLHLFARIPPGQILGSDVIFIEPPQPERRVSSEPVIAGAHVVAGHDGEAQLEVRVRYENGALGTVTLDAACAQRLLEECAAENARRPSRPALATSSRRPPLKAVS